MQLNKLNMIAESHLKFEKRKKKVRTSSETANQNWAWFGIAYTWGKPHSVTFDLPLKFTWLCLIRRYVGATLGQRCASGDGNRPELAAMVGHRRVADLCG